MNTKPMDEKEYADIIDLVLMGNCVAFLDYDVTFVRKSNQVIEKTYKKELKDFLNNLDLFVGFCNSCNIVVHALPYTTDIEKIKKVKMYHESLKYKNIIFIGDTLNIRDVLGKLSNVYAFSLLAVYNAIEREITYKILNYFKKLG